MEEIAIAERFERANDDYSSIIVKALADRFAEAFAERMHECVRKEFWGYAPDENFAPDRADRRTLSRHPPGARLSGAARPHRKGDIVPSPEGRGGNRRDADGELRHVAGLLGFRPLHRPPEAYYFGVAKVERDQVEDYAARKAMPIGEIERWLGPILNYVPAPRAEAASKR